MIDITEDLRLYKELKEWHYQNLLQLLDALDDENSNHEHTAKDPRNGQYYALAKKLKQIALDQNAVSISDPTLHRVFHEIRTDAFDEEIDDDGSIPSDDFFYGLIDKRRPEQIARNLADTKPLVSLGLIPPQVESLVSETRDAYCLGLPTACISLCRSTVERVIVDIAVRCGRIENGDRLGQMGMCDRISLLIDRSVSHSSPLRKQINAFMEATSNVIHSNTDADMASALKLYHDSLSLIQSLYGQYQNQFKK